MVANVRDGVSVRNELVAETLRPAASTAVARTVYLVAVVRAHRLCHAVAWGSRCPGTGWPPPRTVTPVIRPCVTVTEMPESGLACRLSVAGVMRRRAALATGGGWLGTTPTISADGPLHGSSPLNQAPADDWAVLAHQALTADREQTKALRGIPQEGVCAGSPNGI